MAIDKKTVEYVGHLARIDLSEAEVEKMSAQLAQIIDFIDKLKSADITGVSPTSHILPLKNVLREDIVTESLSSQKALDTAPAKEKSFFVVPKIIE